MTIFFQFSQILKKWLNAFENGLDFFYVILKLNEIFWILYKYVFKFIKHKILTTNGLLTKKFIKKKREKKI